MGHSEDGNTPKFADTTLSTPQIVDNPNPDFRPSLKAFRCPGRTGLSP